MSAIAGIFGSRNAVTDAQVAAILRAMSERGAGRVAVWREADVVLAVQRHEWEKAPCFSGDTLIAADAQFVVAADASLYYRDDLRRALRAAGVHAPVDASPAELSLAAFRAWGTECFQKLEGDFALVIWDRVRRRAVCARDFGGKRPLHYAHIGEEFVVASTIGAVSAHPRCPADLNLPVIAATAAGLFFSAGPETCYRAVFVVPSAHHLAWSRGRLEGPSRHWGPRFDGEDSPLSTDDAADLLRQLLCEATRERLDPSGPSTIWMSGGWDSTAVFAAAQTAAASAGRAGAPVAVSISYPQGDPGREDELIEEVAAWWRADVHWLQIGDIPFLDQEAERAARRDEPYGHMYEHWNRALVAGSRARGSRIALDGNGGDQLFQSSDIFLADLFREGRWWRMAREWAARPRGGAREFFRTVIQPNLPAPLHRLARAMRGGRRLRHYLERRMPSWIDAGYLERQGLVERDLESLAGSSSATHAQRELDFYFRCHFLSRAFSQLGTFALSAGVELRSPLLDKRIVEFALTRPWWERSSGSETKTLLRRAMRGLLPPGVLASRPRRTGTTAGYSHSWVRDRFPALLSEMLETPMLLAELGIVEPDALRRASASYRGYDGYACVNLVNTLRTEMWLRGHSGRPATNEPSTFARMSVAKA